MLTHRCSAGTLARVSTIFIAYRKCDAKDAAFALHRDMVAVFGEHAVFLDDEGLHAGPWLEQILTRISLCQVFIVVVGPGWLGASNANGQQRIQQPNDVHRGEIAAALSRASVLVIPVLVNGASLPGAQALPADLQALVAGQGRVVHERRRHRRIDIEELASDIAVHTGLQADLSAYRPNERRLLAALGSGVRATAFAAGLVVVGGVAAYLAGMTLDATEYVFLALVCMVLVLVYRGVRKHRSASGSGGAGP